jgi:hypothetical protein
VGAPESNAGDAFHFWWAAARALALVEPGADLRLLAIEGLTVVDDPDDEYETVDIAEYYGGKNVPSASRVVLSQLKHSTRHPDAAWTTARFCQRRGRRGATGNGRSVVADLATAYRRIIDQHGMDGAAKTTVALVTNQPAHAALLEAIAAAANWVRAEGSIPTKAALLAALDQPHAAAITTIARSIGNILPSQEFCTFLTSLDLSNTGALGHAALARAVRIGAADLTPGTGPDSARRLFHLVQQQALPDSRRGGLTAADVLAELGAADVADLYPAPPRLPDIPDPIPAPAARAIADAAAAAAADGGFVVAHGPAGAGKTTALMQTRSHLPPGSELVVFDCYGGGDYLSSGDERHTPQRFVAQVVNEVAQLRGTSLMVQPPALEADLWRRLSRTLLAAAATLDPGAVLVIAIDAADNAAVAAHERGDRGFLRRLAALDLPDRVAVVLTARTHRVQMLGMADAVHVEVTPFDSAASAAHLRRYRPAATDADAAEFHARTGGNPRAQFYALTQAAQTEATMAVLLDSCNRTPEPVFADLVESALRVIDADAGGEHWLAAMLALARPVPVATLAEALSVNPTAVTAFAAGLDPGIKVADNAIQFRDEDFETYVRGRVDPAAVTAAHDGLATLFLAARRSDADAAAHVADHLAAAGRFMEVLNLVLTEDAPAGIADGFRREHVQARRLDLAARAAAEVGDAAAAVRVASRGCDTASRLDTLTRLVDAQLDLVVRYADIELLRTHALRQTHRNWLGPILMKLAAALSRDPLRRGEARAELDRAQAWLSRWMAGTEDETGHWDIDADDVAAAAEARYRLDGFEAALEELARWYPAEFVVDAVAAFAERIAGEASPDQAQDALRRSSLPPAAQAPLVARFATGTAFDTEWLEENVPALVGAVTAPTLNPWQAGIVDAAVRHGDAKVAAALANHWAVELPTGQGSFRNIGTSGIITLRCHAAAAVLAGVPLIPDDILPASLQQPADRAGRANDQRDHDRREWLATVGPLAVAAELEARAVTGAASAEDVEAAAAGELAARCERASHRWFSYDHSYRAWSCLITEAAIDASAPVTLIDQLADAAPQLLKDGAAEAWLDIARTLVRRGVHLDRATNLCVRAATAAGAAENSAADRLDLLGAAADLAARLDHELGRALFDLAVDAATDINDDAARLLAVHANLAIRADLPSARGAETAARLVAATEAVARHVSARDIVPYEAIAGAAARLHPPTGLAAVSRWDDEARAALSDTLPAAAVGAVDRGGVPAWQALPLDHLIDNDSQRLAYQLDIATRLDAAGAAGRAATRLAVARSANWIRCRVAARDQPALAARLLEWTAARGLDGGIRPTLDPVVALAVPERRPTSRGWSPGPDSSASETLLAEPGARSWQTLAEDVVTLEAAHVYSDRTRQFITGVVLAVAPTNRVAVLDAIAALQEVAATVTFSALADCLTAWHDWPPARAWARDALPRLLADQLPEHAWRLDTDRLVEQLHAFGDDDEIRRAILLALPETRPQLTAYGWQNIAGLLGRLCPPAAATDALLGLLDGRIPTEQTVPPPADDEPGGPIPPLLWSAFGHPRRAMRWRAAHVVRELLSHPGASTSPLVSALVGLLDRTDAGRYRDPALHFYRLSAMAALLVALHRVALDRPALLAPHLGDLARHARNVDPPHAQIRELARLAALAVAAEGHTAVEALRMANTPDRCHIARDRQHVHNDRLVNDHRYDFDIIDTIPYWYSPLAGVFDVPVDTVANLAEMWIIDRWGLDRDDWWSDARELRNQRSWERMSHRHGSIPSEENLQLYIEYHAMMAAAGVLADAGTPVRVESWDDEDPWRQWLDPHLPRSGNWLADLAAPVPAEVDLCGTTASTDDDWETPRPSDHDQALDVETGTLPERFIVKASISLRHRDARERIHIASALASPIYAQDLQRALAAATNPTDWKLPYEGEQEFEVDAGEFQLHGWIADTPYPRTSSDEHDPYAHGLQHAVPLPGEDFCTRTGSNRNPLGLALIAADGSQVAAAEQWADPDTDSDTFRGTSSSGYRVRVDRGTLLRYLAVTGTVLILEVQLARRRDAYRGDYRPPSSRIYLLDANGRITGS